MVAAALVGRADSVARVGPVDPVVARMAIVVPAPIAADPVVAPAAISLNPTFSRRFRIFAKHFRTESATPDQIKTKLTALRDARAKAKTELEKAQKDLRDMLTVKQEAILVMMNVLP